MFCLIPIFVPCILLFIHVLSFLYSTEYYCRPWLFSSSYFFLLSGKIKIKGMWPQTAAVQLQVGH